LLKNSGLVKTIKFKDPTYLGDPINIIRIFNEKEVDELVFLDITATLEKRKPPFELLQKITDECFMPLGYGGGIHNLEDIQVITSLGVEKVIINSYASIDQSFISQAADRAGSQAIVVSIDVKKDLLGRYMVHTHSGRKNTGIDPVQYAQKMEAAGAGEIFLTSIDRDGTMQGYDLELIRKVATQVSIPVVACGGAGNIDDLSKAVKIGKANAAAAGSMFVFQGKHRAVLISYPSQEELKQAFESESVSL
jgi:cyclase